MDLAEAYVGPMVDAIYRRLKDRDFALEDPEVVMRVMRWRNGALSGSDLSNEPGLGSSRSYQPGEMSLPSKPKPGLRRMHQEMNSEAASSSSPLRIAVPPKRARVEQELSNDLS